MGSLRETFATLRPLGPVVNSRYRTTPLNLDPTTHPFPNLIPSSIESSLDFSSCSLRWPTMPCSVNSSPSNILQCSGSTGTRTPLAPISPPYTGRSVCHGAGTAGKGEYLLRVTLLLALIQVESNIYIYISDTLLSLTQSHIHIPFFTIKYGGA